MLAQSIAFAPEKDAEIFAQIPARAGVFLLRAHADGAEPYLSKSSNLRRRISKLLGNPDEAGVSKRLNLRERCAAIEFSQTGSDFENTLLLYRVLREYFPKTYAKRLRLSPPAMIKVDWANAYPRAYVTTRLGKLEQGEDAPTYIGPFRSRAAAEKYANDVLDLFKSRRCNFELNPDPTFPGCVYSEMKMCLAPCFKGCTDEEYRAEVKRVEAFFTTRGEAMIAPLAASRDQMSEAMEFESAKELHERVEKLKGIARQADEIVRRIEKLDCVMVQAGVGGIALFRFSECQLLGPIQVGGETPPGQPARRPHYEADSLLAPIEELVPKKNVSTLEASEHLSLLKRWYYRGQRAGEIIFRNNDGTWPVRKIVNACERVASPRRHGDTEGSSTPVPEGSGQG